MRNPNPHSYYEEEAAKLYKADINQYNKKVLEWTQKYAT